LKWTFLGVKLLSKVGDTNIIIMATMLVKKESVGSFISIVAMACSNGSNLHLQSYHDHKQPELGLLGVLYDMLHTFCNQH
jgi:hypothetical protein